MYTTNSTNFPDIEFDTIQSAAQALQQIGEAATIYQDGKPVAQYGPDGLVIYD